MRAALLLLLLVGLPSVQARTPEDEKAIISAARSYTVSHSDVENFHVAIEKIQSGYARVKVIPSHGQTDAAWVFLKRRGDRWVGLALGTGFEPDDYKRLRIPKKLWIK